MSFKKIQRSPKEQRDFVAAFPHHILITRPNVFDLKKDNDISCSGQCQVEREQRR